MASKRTSNWRPQVDGDAVGAIRLCVRPWFALLLRNDGQPYSSNSMKKGIDNEGLAVFKDLLTALFKLDPRGAYFSQGDVKVRPVWIPTHLQILKP